MALPRERVRSSSRRSIIGSVMVLGVNGRMALPARYCQLDLRQYWYVMVLNSLYMSILPAILATIIGTLAGYGFARFAFPGGMIRLTVLLLGQMFPGPSLCVPIYFVVSSLGLHDNLNALVLVYTAFHVPVATWLMSGFIRTIPLELEEAARIDGASLLQVLLQIVLPLARIGILTVAMLVFMAF